MRYLASARLLIAVLVMTGCASIDDTLGKRGKGERRTYSIPYEQMWDITVAAVRSQGLAIKSRNREAGQMVVGSSEQRISHCWLVGVFLEPVGPRATSTKTQVEMVLTRDMGICEGALGNVADRVFAGLEEEIDDWRRAQRPSNPAASKRLH